jgi:predicted transcriptional regulator
LVAAPEHLDETYRQAVLLRQFRAGELSERLGVTLQNVNNRLKRLVSNGTLKREKNIPSNRGGKEFVYTIPAPWCEGPA